MKKPITILSFVIFFLILSSFNPQSFNTNIKLFYVEHIELQQTNFLDKKNLEFVFKNRFKNVNIFSIDSKNIEELKDNYDLIKEIKIKKIYPNKLNIKVFEKNIIAIFIKNKKTYYISEDGEQINFFKNDKLNDLPSIVGGKKNFAYLYDTLKELNFPIKDIKTYYYYEIERWDIMLKNKKIIKLPIKDYKESIKSYLKYQSDINFYEYKVFDFRIRDQLILK